MIRLGGLAALALLSASAPARAEVVLAGGGGVAATWLAARVGVPASVAGELAVIGSPGEDSIRVILRARRERQAPAVIVLHGCAGISGEEETVLYLLTLNGFAVFMPDSFARPGRSPQCDVATSTAVIDPGVYAQRGHELDFARRQVARIPWVDQRRVFLIGFSEGGATAATQAGDGFAGVVIVGWHCGGRSAISGLRLPPATPVLSMVMADDPWYENQRGRHCGEHFAGRPASRSLVLPGNGHSVLRASDVATGDRVKREILKFMRTVGSSTRISAGDSG